MENAVVAQVVRSGFVESEHRGAVVALHPDGSLAWSVGSVREPIFPRSCNKPLQASAMVRSGLPVRERLLALACASHSGEPFHLEGVRDILSGAGLDEAALQTPADWPLDDVARDQWLRSGASPSALAMNCSGKHAAMLATCVVNGWDTATYTEPRHPLQQGIARVFAELTGEPVAATGVDGCGAPLLAASLLGLARAFSGLVRSAPGTAEQLVADAISRFPEYVSGTRRDEASLLGAYPGAIGKAGAEACYVVAMPDGAAVSLKITDGGSRARPVVMAAALRRLGYDSGVLDEIGKSHVDGGGRPVGEVRAVMAPSDFKD